MKKPQHHFSLYLRTVTAVLLLLSIAFKVTIFAITITTNVKSEVLAATGEENSDEAKAKTNLEKEFIISSHYYTKRIITITPIIHYTAYYINYQTCYYNRITIPPPDFDLPFST